MPTRYQQLRQSILRLAQSADEQHSYLERVLGGLTNNGDASSYGNDELALEFDGIYTAVGDMRDWGEITTDEIDAAKPLHARLEALSGEKNADFWRREALWSDPRWEQTGMCSAGFIQPPR